MLFIDFWSRLTQTNLIVGIIVAILGLGLVFLAQKIVKNHKKTEELAKDDQAVMVLRGFGLVLIMVAMFIMILY